MVNEQQWNNTAITHCINVYRQERTWQGWNMRTKSRKQRGDGFLQKNLVCLMLDFWLVLQAPEKLLRPRVREKDMCLFIQLFPTWKQSERYGLITIIVWSQDNVEKSKV